MSAKKEEIERKVYGSDITISNKNVKAVDKP